MGQKLCLCTSISGFSSHHSQSAETVANNDDLVTELLLCLPIKSVVKFKSVSKRWYSLISSPQFSFRLNLIPQPLSGLWLQYISSNPNFPIVPYYDFINLNSNPSPAPLNSLIFVHDSSPVRVLQSCNGLFLCVNVPLDLYNDDGQRNYYIYNPTTKQHTLLPPHRKHYNCSASLAFDPSISPHYKVIIAYNCEFVDYNSDHIQIYSSKTRLWKHCGANFTQPIRKTHSVFWNNAIHWIRNEDTSLYLDLAEEERREMPMPATSVGDWERNYIYFGVSGGHLHLVVRHENYDRYNPVFDLHEMDRDYSGWFLKYCFHLRPLLTAFTIGQFYEFSMLCVVREKNEDDSYFVVHLSDKVIRWNFKDNTFKMLRDIYRDPQWSEDGVCRIFQYSESLACV